LQILAQIYKNLKFFVVTLDITTKNYYTSLIGCKKKDYNKKTRRIK